MLTAMWLFPLVAAAVAFVFAALLVRQYAERRRPYQLLWAISLAMYGAASLAAVLGVLHGWSPFDYRVYWSLGAVLNVPFLAAGELELLVRNRAVQVAIDLVLVFLVAYAVTVLRNASLDTASAAKALAERLPSGKDVFGNGTPAHRLPQLISIPSYVILLAGALWSAWKMRASPELKDRFVGTLLIVLGASVVAGGATFAAYGNLPGFCITLVVGIVAMFVGFLRASRPMHPAASVSEAATSSA
jgi:hypothetical protein